MYNTAMLVNTIRNMHNTNLNFYNLHISNKCKQNKSYFIFIIIF